MTFFAIAEFSTELKEFHVLLRKPSTFDIFRWETFETAENWQYQYFGLLLKRTSSAQMSRMYREMDLVYEVLSTAEIGPLN